MPATVTSMPVSRYLGSLLAMAALLLGFGPGVEAQTCDDWRLVNPLPVEHDLNGVVYGGGRFVAVGDAGTVLVSPDELGWEIVAVDTEQDLHAVLYTGERFVAAGAAGTVLTSPDGLSWSSGQPITGATLLDLAWDGARLLAVGSGGTILSGTLSGSGSSWRAEESGTTVTLRGVTWTGRELVAVGDDGTVLSSRNGRSWQSVDAGTEIDLTAVATFAGRIIIAAASGDHASSADGLSWSEWQRYSTAVYRLSSCGDRLLVLGADHGYSDDGESWRHSSTTGLLLELYGAACGPDSTVGVGAGGQIAMSYDRGEHWRMAMSVTGRPLQALAVGGPGMVAVGGSATGGGVILRSRDGVAWNQELSDSYLVLHDVVWGAKGYITVGADVDFWSGGGVVLISEDGSSWDYALESLANTTFFWPYRFSAVTWDGTRYIVTGSEGTVLFSEDGRSWRLEVVDLNPEDPSGLGLTGVASDQETIVATGYSTLIYSRDGISWTMVEPTPPERLHTAAWGNDRFVVAGDNGLIMTSNDGADWQQAVSGTDLDIRDLIWTGSTFVAAGEHGLLLSSVDGVDWRQHDSGSQRTLLAVAWTGSQLLVAGEWGLLRLDQCTAAGEPPVASFAWRPARVVAGAPLRLFDLSAGAPDSWLWDFGDGSTADSRSPSHRYTGEGSYPVSLTAGNEHGSDTATVQIQVEAACGTPAVPELSVPAVSDDGAYMVSWTGMSGFVEYQVEEATDPAFSDPFGLGCWAPCTGLMFPRSWTDARTYYYRVQATQYCFDGTYTAAWSEPVQISLEPSLATPGTHLAVVPAVAHAFGSHGTRWLSDLVLRNPNQEEATAVLFPLGEDGGGNEHLELQLAAGSAVRLDDALARLAPQQVIGGVLVGSGHPLQLSSRTYNDQPEGSFGQLIDGAPLSRALGTGQEGRLLQLSDNQQYRTNLGFANPGPEAAEVTLELLRDDGASLGSATYQLPAFSHRQVDGILAGLGDEPVDNAVAVVKADSGRVLAYSSVIDNYSGDPVAQIAAPATAQLRLVSRHVLPYQEYDPWLVMLMLGDRYVAVGEQQVGISSDALSWQLTPVDQHLLTAVSNGSRIVALGCGTVMTSDDGVSWSSRAWADGCALQVAWGNGTWLLLSRKVGWEGDVYLERSRVYASSDATGWTPLATLEEVLQDLVWAGDQWVAVGEAGAILTSDDAVTWTARDSGTFANLESVAWSGSILLASGGFDYQGAPVLSSTDGVSWSAVYPGAFPGGPVWAGDRFVMVEGGDGFPDPLTGEYVGNVRPGFLISNDGTGTSWSKLDSDPKIPLGKLLWDGSAVLSLEGRGTVSRLVWDDARRIVPAAAHGVGYNSSAWRSDLTLHNRSTQVVQCTIELLEHGVANPQPKSVMVELQPGASRRFDDALHALFNFAGTAALAVIADPQQVQVTSRTYTEGAAGTYGQLVPALGASEAITSFNPGTLLQLSQSADRSQGFRSNIGLVSDCSEPMEVAVEQLSAGGELLGTLQRELAPFEYLQIAEALSEVSADDVEQGVAVVSTTTPRCRLYAYASVIDNRSNDPILVPAKIAAQSTGWMN